MSEEITNFSVGVYIYDLMQQMSLTTEQLSIRSRLSMSTIEGILNGERDMTERLSKRLGIALGLPKDYLIKVYQEKCAQQH